ncbi:hypothetical protein QUF76_07360 [Desulfobacterales bacterium HSG16]|nr:hypothetical protein [Desulfobacterales bacterium HSG16]
MRFIPFLFILAIVFFIASCSLFQPKSPENPFDSFETERLISKLLNKNDNLKSFKGLGKIKIFSPKGRLTARIAWLVHEPDKMRIEILSIPGQPMATIACDGKRFYYRDEKTLKKIRTKDPDLKKLVSIPVKTSEIISFLSGKTHIESFYSASMTDRSIREESGKSKADKKNADIQEPFETKIRTLELKNMWGKVIERIFIDKDDETIREIEIIKKGKKFLYRVQFFNFKNIDGFSVPHLFIISDDKGSEFHLKIRRFWANCNVNPKGFVLLSKSDQNKLQNPNNRPDYNRPDYNRPDYNRPGK